MADDSMQINGAELPLRRPGNHARALRGWDAADELLLEHGLEYLGARKQLRVLILDDQFGALTLGLRKFSPDTLTVSLADSAVLASALRLNVSSLSFPDGLPAEPSEEPSSWLDPPESSFDLVILRIPRQADYLAWLLRYANQILTPEGAILAGGMIKHMPESSSQVFDELVCPQSVSRARKKARVILSTPGTATLQEWGEQWQGYGLPDTDVQVDGLPAVFSRRKLDIGTRELIPFVRQEVAGLPAGSRVLDLACGNGVLGLTALARRPDLQLTLSDVSSQAVLSARYNADRAFPESTAQFVHCDGVQDLSDDLSPGFDLILLNPPFHEGGVVGDHIALALFQQSSRALAPGGRLLMVGNRHLGYHRTLKQSFSQVRQLAASPKFVVFEAANQESGRV